jgi:hypothetical protein
MRTAGVTTPKLTTVPAAVPAPSEHSEEWLAAARRVRILSWISLAWMTAEGAIAITAGVLAGSIALIGFGIDSAIEGLASGVIIWRFTGRRIHSEAAEDRAQKFVALERGALCLCQRRRGHARARPGAWPAASSR